MNQVTSLVHHHITTLEKQQRAVMLTNMLSFPNTERFLFEHSLLKGNVSYLTVIQCVYGHWVFVNPLFPLMNNHTDTHKLCSEAPLGPIHSYFIWHSEGMKKKTPYGKSLEGKDKRRPIKWKMWSFVVQRVRLNKNKCVTVRSLCNNNNNAFM